MLWPDGWGLWGRLTFQQQLKKEAGVWGMGVGGQVCAGQAGSPRIPAPPLARGGGTSLEVGRSLFPQGRSYGSDLHGAPNTLQYVFMCTVRV